MKVNKARQSLITIIIISILVNKNKGGLISDAFLGLAC